MTYFQRWSRMDAAQRLIVTAAVGIAVLFAWAAFAQVDQITRGVGKVIPSSKAQLVQPAEPSVVAEILVRSGQSVKKGDLLVRLDDSQSSSQLGELQTENDRLAARAQRLDSEASGAALGCEPGTPCAEEARLAQARRDTARAREASLASAVEQRRRDLSEAQATASSLQSSLQLAREQVDMMRPLAAKNIVPQTKRSARSSTCKAGCRPLARRQRALLLRSTRRRPISARPVPISASRRLPNAARSTPVLRSTRKAFAGHRLAATVMNCAHPRTVS